MNEKSMREAFEAAIHSTIPPQTGREGHYLCPTVQSAWNLWQEATRQALERAAVACENERVEDNTGHKGDRGYNLAIKHSAAAIRALKGAHE
jgi:hypothetical protein